MKIYIISHEKVKTMLYSVYETDENVSEMWMPGDLERKSHKVVHLGSKLLFQSFV